MTGILLAGGQSKRMGEDKAFLEFKGKYLYTYPLEVLRKSCDEILVSSNNERFREEGHTIIKDIYQNTGPMGGIFSCLKKANTQKSVVLSCDLPMISYDFIRFLSEKSDNFLITIGQNKKALPEPLAGIYDQSIREKMERLLLSGNFRMSSLVKGPEIQIIDIEKAGFNSDRLYFNVNSPFDIQKLRDIYGK